MRFDFGAVTAAVAACSGIVRRTLVGSSDEGGKAGSPFTPGISTEADIVRELGPPAGVASAPGKRSLSYTGILDADDGTFIPIVGAFCQPAGHGFSTVVFVVGDHGVLESVAYRQ
jgi:hypothetical protein